MSSGHLTVSRVLFQTAAQETDDNDDGKDDNAADDDDNSDCGNTFRITITEVFPQTKTASQGQMVTNAQKG